MLGNVATTLESVPVMAERVREERLEEDGLKVVRRLRPAWPEAAIKAKVFTAGITNKLVGFFRADTDPHWRDMILIRVYGANSDILIDRRVEMRNMLAMYQAGLAPPLLASLENGLVYGFAPGTCLTTQLAREPRVFHLVGQLMAKMHNIRIESLDENGGEESGPPSRLKPPEPCLFRKLRRWNSLLPQGFPAEPDKDRAYRAFLDILTTVQRTSLGAEIDRLEAELTKLGSPVVFCHNDLLLNNIVFNESPGDGRKPGVTFIDYEYGDYNYQAFDIGNHFCEFAGVDEVDFSLYPEKDFQLIWLRHYLECSRREAASGGAKDADGGDKSQAGVEVTDAEVEALYVQVNKFALAAHLFWGVWGFLQAKYSAIDFDYLGYAQTRLQEYFRRRDAFLAL